MSDETAGRLGDMQGDAKQGHTCVFILREHLRRIGQRRRIDDSDSRSKVNSNIGRQLGAMRHRAGVAKCTLQDLRGSAITNWAEKLLIQVVQYLEAHWDIRTSRRCYLAVRSQDSVCASKLLNSILNKAYADLQRNDTIAGFFVISLPFPLTVCLAA